MNKGHFGDNVNSADFFLFREVFLALWEVQKVL